MKIAKRIACWTLLLSLLLVPGAFAQQDSGHRFSADGLNFRIAIDQDWVDAVRQSKLAFLPRTDSAVKVDGVNGYGIVYFVPSLEGFEAMTSLDEAQQWLDENCLALGAVVEHALGADTSSRFPGFSAASLGELGETAFTLMRPTALDTAKLTADEAEIAALVHGALADANRVILLDPARDYGVLGAFDATALDGTHVTQDVVSQVPLTLVNIWGTFCSPCLDEMPTLAALSERYAGRLQMIGIVSDGYDGETLDLAREILEMTGVSYINLPPVLPSVLANAQFVPTTIFVDANGQQVGETVVGAHDEAGWVAQIESRLAMVE